MKGKKVIGIVTAALMGILALGTTGNTYAADSSYVLGITNVREDRGAYQIAPTGDGEVRKIWKIVSYPNTGSSIINYNNAFYCLKAEHGFMQANQSSTTDVRKVYDTSFDMKTQKTEVLSRLQSIDVFTADPASYNKVMWILDTMYLPKQSEESAKKALLDAAGVTDESYTTPKITNEDIDVVQQMAIWYFTNPTSPYYHNEELPILNFNNYSGSDSGYKTFSAWYDDTINNKRDGYYRQLEAEMLYKYLIDTAKTKGDYISTDTNVPISLVKDNLTIETSEEYHIIGPLKVNVDTARQYAIAELKFTDQNGNIINLTGENKLLNSEKNEVTSGNLKDVLGQQFYIKVPTTTTITKVNFNITASYSRTTATYYTTNAASYKNEQPVVLVEKQNPVFSDNASIIIPEKKEFDLVLRKSITKMNGVVPQVSRLPVVDATNLQSGNDTTAIYNHPKNDLETAEGQFIEYTLTIYNEGEKKGYAAEIKDYLPAGIEFVEIVSPSGKYSAIANKNADGSSVVTITNTGKTVLDSYTSGIPANEAVTLKCKVTAQAGQNDIRLVNIAEISKYYDSELDKEITQERDSQIANFPSDKINNTYAGNGIQGDYTKGQEDDDDFEAVVLPGKYFDLALRKFISKINGVVPQTSREPKVDITPLITGEKTTANYNHSKLPLSVKIGDTITYTIRVYNEGQLDGYVNEITDHLPPELEFLPDNDENIANGWIYDENDLTLRTIKTTNLSKETEENNKIKAFNGIVIAYKEITVTCKVKDNVISGQKITNIADITKFTDGTGNTVVDRDSQAANVQLPGDTELSTYKDAEINSGAKYIPGQQDDDDFEKVKIDVFDLALRKFITKVDDQQVTTRIPQLSLDQKGNIKYTHTKEPVSVQNGNVVTYTLRIFNEGDIAGYASEITDNLPEGLEFLPANETNKTYRWKMIDKDGKETTKVTEAVKITTDYLAKDQEKTAGENLIKAYDKQAGLSDSNPDYREVKVAFKVIEPNTSDRILTNTAEISEDTDENGNPIEDIDSIPGNNKEGEDDIDVEHVKLVYFDLALRKFITKVNSTEINNRVPQLSFDESGNIKYTHTKEPVEVEQKDIVTYTLRIFNEGKIAGYASEVTDDLPEGLEFLPENETNKNYRWKMIDKDGKETTKVAEAVKITTDYLAKEQEKTAEENLIKAFDKEAGLSDTNPDYREVKIAFKVTEPNTSDRILINTAEISNDTDEKGKPIEDVDSTPGNNKEGEDDIDIEKVKVKYFDLALKKWVTQAIVIEDGKETITNTGHTGDENPEPIVKVDLKDKKINKVTVKFAYKIKVTNEGQIAGYAKEVKDYIPEGLKFNAKDNPKWKQLSEKVVVTSQLENTLLKPGESATVDIILTWENSETNMGVKVNVAEISKDYNESGTPDIDSTPDNKKPGEDDIDDAPVMLSIKTGEARYYIILTTAILITLAGGIILIKKFVM